MERSLIFMICYVHSYLFDPKIQVYTFYKMIGYQYKPDIIQISGEISQSVWQIYEIGKWELDAIASVCELGDLTESIGCTDYCVSQVSVELMR